MCSRQRHRNAPRRAFSLVELLVVLVIIGLLAGAVTMGVRNFLVKGKQNTARMEIASICAAIDSFYTIYGRYPSNEEGIDLLSRKTDKLPDPLLKQPPIDPWGRRYQYNQPGRSGPYEVICYGADGREGGEGEDADLVSWNLKEAK